MRARRTKGLVFGLALAALAGMALASSARSEAAVSGGPIEYEIRSLEGGGEVEAVQGGKRLWLKKFDSLQWDKLRNTVGDTVGYVNENFASGTEYVHPEGDTLASREAATKAYEAIEKSGGGGDVQLAGELESVAESEGIMPTVSELAATSGDIALAAGVFYVGYKIGGTLDTVLGFESGEPIEHTEAEYLEHEAQYLRPVCLKTSTYCGESHVEPGALVCPGGGSCATESGYHRIHVPATAGEMFVHTEYGYSLNTEGVDAGGAPKCQVIFGFKPWEPVAPTPYIGVLGGSGREENCWKGVAVEGVFYAKAHPQHSGTRWHGEVAHVGAAGAPSVIRNVTVSPPPAPTEVQPKPRLDPHEEGGAVVPPPLTIQEAEEAEGEEEEGKPVPPLLPEIPPAEEGETGTEYQKRLEELGFTNTHLYTLSESRADPSKGPEEVVGTNPAEGTRTAPGTNISIDQNPSTEAPPVAGGGGGGGIEGPAEPGIKLPHFGVLCTKFPFGVPCWIVSEFASWEATASAPELEIGGWSVRGVAIPAAHVSLAPLEPVMEVVRPMMVVFSVIGIVLLFYRFATGSGAGRGADEGED